MYRFNLLPRSNKPSAGPLQIARNSYKCDGLHSPSHQSRTINNILGKTNIVLKIYTELNGFI